MYEDKKAYINHRRECQMYEKSKLTKAEMVFTDTLSGPFKKVSLDLVDYFQESVTGAIVTLTFQDDLSKCMQSVSLQDMEEKLLIKHFSKKLPIWNSYSIIEFLSKMLKDVVN